MQFLVKGEFEMLLLCVRTHGYALRVSPTSPSPVDLCIWNAVRTLLQYVVYSNRCKCRMRTGCCNDSNPELKSYLHHAYVFQNFVQLPIGEKYGRSLKRFVPELAGVCSKRWSIHYVWRWDNVRNFYSLATHIAGIIVCAEFAVHMLPICIRWF